jgi:hypothetical protein
MAITLTITITPPISGSILTGVPLAGPTGTIVVNATRSSVPVNDLLVTMALVDASTGLVDYTDDLDGATLSDFTNAAGNVDFNDLSVSAASPAGGFKLLASALDPTSMSTVAQVLSSAFTIVLGEAILSITPSAVYADVNSNIISDQEAGVAINAGDVVCMSPTLGQWVLALAAGVTPPAVSLASGLLGIAVNSAKPGQLVSVWTSGAIYLGTADPPLIGVPYCISAGSPGKICTVSSLQNATDMITILGIGDGMGRLITPSSYGIWPTGITHA